jgi:hypothetical protein
MEGMLQTGAKCDPLHFVISQGGTSGQREAEERAPCAVRCPPLGGASWLSL